MVSADLSRRLAAFCDSQAPLAEAALGRVPLRDESVLGFGTERRLMEPGPVLPDMHLFTTKVALSAFCDLPMRLDDERDQLDEAFVSLDHPYDTGMENLSVNVKASREETRSNACLGGGPFVPAMDYDTMLEIAAAIPRATFRWIGRYAHREAVSRLHLVTGRCSGSVILERLARFGWAIVNGDLATLLTRERELGNEIVGLSVGIRDGAIVGPAIGFELNSDTAVRRLQRHGLIRDVSYAPGRGWLKAVVFPDRITAIKEYRVDYRAGE